MTTLFKRGEKLVFKLGVQGVEALKKVLRHLVYNKKTKLWETRASISVFFDLYTKIPRMLNSKDPETMLWVTHMKALYPRLHDIQQGTAKITLPDTIDYVLKPYKHQMEALAFALYINKCALWLDMGLGKTYTAITLAKLRHSQQHFGGVNRVLVIAPRSLLYQWETEIKRLVDSAEVFSIVGTPYQKEKAIEKISAAEGFTWTLISYESVGNVYDDLVALDYDMFILDEATKIKNPKAKRTEKTVDLCNTIRYGIELTGMAYVNSPLDLFSQFSAIDPTVFGVNSYVFSHRYINYASMTFGKIVLGYKNMEELKSRSYLAAFARTKDQCLDLPARVYQVRKLPVNEDQYKWYTSLLDQLAQSKDGTGNYQQTYVVALLEKFTQITSGFILTDDHEYIWLDSPKYAEAWDIISNSKEKFIIWARHTYTLKKLAAYFTGKERNKCKLNVQVLDRHSSASARQYIKEQFKSGNIDVLILQLQSECRGNDFTCQTSSVSSIFFENSASIEERSQAEDRQHRIGMVGTALYIDLVCEDTYDEGIQVLLEGKKTITSYIREQNLQILLGSGGTISLKKSKSQKRPKSPAEVAQRVAKAEEEAQDFSEIEGMETFNDQ